MLSWRDVEALQPPVPPQKIAYGSEPLQFGELRVPPGTGPFPLLMLVHGGCWLSDFDYVHARPLAEAITRAGYATWTIEYRRLGDAGGGWPNTFLDVGLALDHLRTLAAQQPLDLQRVIVAGHSAGGQLALWLASRARLPTGSALHVANPLAVTGVIGLAPITDLATYRIGPADSCHASVDHLLDGGPDTRAERYAQTSPLQRLPLGVPQSLIQGAGDPIVSAAATHRYAEAAKAAGDRVSLHVIDCAGHFEPIVPGASTWAPLLQALRELGH